MILLVGGLFGLVRGSFLNVVIHWVPLHRSIVWPSSSCPHCGVHIKMLYNVPVLSCRWVYLVSVLGVGAGIFALALAYPGGMGAGT